MAKILIIDDEKSIRKSLREILEFEKYKIEEAEDGMAGLAMASSENYDLILCDIKMRKLDGMELLNKLNEQEIDSPIVMMSGHGNIETAVEAVKKGAYDFLAKPIDLNRLLVTVRNAIERSGLVTETKVLKKNVNKNFEMKGESKPI